jgi:hypothetical protein
MQGSSANGDGRKLGPLGDNHTEKSWQGSNLVGRVDTVLIADRLVFQMRCLAEIVPVDCPTVKVDVGS